MLTTTSPPAVVVNMPTFPTLFENPVDQVRVDHVDGLGDAAHVIEVHPS